MNENDACEKLVLFNVSDGWPDVVILAVRLLDTSFISPLISSLYRSVYERHDDPFRHSELPSPLYSKKSLPDMLREAHFSELVSLSGACGALRTVVSIPFRVVDITSVAGACMFMQLGYSPFSSKYFSSASWITVILLVRRASRVSF